MIFYTWTTRRTLSASDLPLMSAILKVMAELWGSIKCKLEQPEKKTVFDHLCKCLGSGELQVLLDYFVRSAGFAQIRDD